MRAIGLASLVMVLLTSGLVALTDGPAPVELPLPPRGEAVAAWMPDGLPVFVAHADDGTVHVLDARNPHRHGWWILAGWCSSSGLFEDPWHGSRFTMGGQWAGGPAPTGLTPYEAHVRDGVVLAGARGQAPPRDPRLRHGQADLPEYRPRGPSCLSSEAPGAKERLLLHDQVLPAQASWVDQAIGTARGRPKAWVPAEGALLAIPGRHVRLCRHGTGEPPRCAGEVAWEGSRYRSSWEGLAWTRYRGRLLVEVSGGRVQDVAVLAGGRWDQGIDERHEP